MRTPSAPSLKASRTNAGSILPLHITLIIRMFGGILNSAYSSQVCACVAAPVAQETDYFRFKLIIVHSCFYLHQHGFYLSKHFLRGEVPHRDGLCWTSRAAYPAAFAQGFNHVCKRLSILILAFRPHCMHIGAHKPCSHCINLRSRLQRFLPSQACS